MSYIQGFLLPVPHDKKDAYREMAEGAVPFFRKHGMVRMVECWGEDVPRGETTDMYRGVDAAAGENVVFSWVDWGSKEICDKAAAAMMEDPEMKMPDDMPFDSKRMVYAGFETLGEQGGDGETGYVQGYVAPVPKANRQAFADMCAAMRDIASDSGALRAVDGWGENLEDGKVTDFKRAVKCEDGEAVAFGFTEWPSRQVYEEGREKMRADRRMPGPGDMPLDGKRLIFGGFEVLLDTDRE